MDSKTTMQMLLWKITYFSLVSFGLIILCLPIIKEMLDSYHLFSRYLHSDNKIKILEKSEELTLEEHISRSSCLIFLKYDSERNPKWTSGVIRNDEEFYRDKLPPIIVKILRSKNSSIESEEIATNLHDIDPESKIDRFIMNRVDDVFSSDDFNCEDIVNGTFFERYTRFFTNSTVSTKLKELLDVFSEVKESISALENESLAIMQVEKDRINVYKYVQNNGSFVRYSFDFFEYVPDKMLQVHTNWDDLQIVFSVNENKFILQDSKEVTLVECQEYSGGDINELLSGNEDVIYELIIDNSVNHESMLSNSVSSVDLQVDAELENGSNQLNEIVSSVDLQVDAELENGSNQLNEDLQNQEENVQEVVEKIVVLEDEEEIGLRPNLVISSGEKDSESSVEESNTDSHLETLNESSEMESLNVSKSENQDCDVEQITARLEEYKPVDLKLNSTAILSRISNLGTNPSKAIVDRKTSNDTDKGYGTDTSPFEHAHEMDESSSEMEDFERKDKKALNAINNIQIEDTESSITDDDDVFENTVMTDNFKTSGIGDSSNESDNVHSETSINSNFNSCSTLVFDLNTSTETVTCNKPNLSNRKPLKRLNLSMSNLDNAVLSGLMSPRMKKKNVLLHLESKNSQNNVQIQDKKNIKLDSKDKNKNTNSEADDQQKNKHKKLQYGKRLTKAKSEEECRDTDDEYLSAFSGSNRTSADSLIGDKTITSESNLINSQSEDTTKSLESSPKNNIFKFMNKVTTLRKKSFKKK